MNSDLPPNTPTPLVHQPKAQMKGATPHLVAEDLQTDAGAQLCFLEAREVLRSSPSRGHFFFYPLTGEERCKLLTPALSLETEMAVGSHIPGGGVSCPPGEGGWCYEAQPPPWAPGHPSPLLHTLYPLGKCKPKGQSPLQTACTWPWPLDLVPCASGGKN